MKRAIVAVILFFLGAACGFAQTTSDEPATKQDVERYLEVAHSREMMGKIIEAMTRPLHEMVREQFKRDQDKLPPDFEEHMNRVLDDMLKGMPFDQMLDAMVPSYQKHFTRDDIHALTLFYSSPVGQKVLHELPDIMAEAMNSMMPIMTRYMESVQERMQQEFANMLRQSHPGELPHVTRN